MNSEPGKEDIMMTQETDLTSISDRIDRDVALTRLANDAGNIMTLARDALTASKQIPGGPLPAATQKLLEDLERAANAATHALCPDAKARY